MAFIGHSGGLARPPIALGGSSAPSRLVADLVSTRSARGSLRAVGCASVQLIPLRPSGGSASPSHFWSRLRARGNAGAFGFASAQFIAIARACSSVGVRLRLRILGRDCVHVGNAWAFGFASARFIAIARACSSVGVRLRLRTLGRDCVRVGNAGAFGFAFAFLVAIAWGSGWAFGASSLSANSSPPAGVGRVGGRRVCSEADLIGTGRRV